MLYGTMIRVLPDGPSFAPAALAPIGIHADSRCWGLWVPPDPAPGSTTSDGPSDLVVSTIHPLQWQFTFSLELKVLDRKGAMAALAQILSDNDVNIIFTQCTPSGHTHATWNIVGEALDVKRQVGTLGYGDLGGSQLRDKQWELARFLLLRKLVALKETLKSAHQTVGELLQDKFEQRGSEFDETDVMARLGVTADEYTRIELESAEQRTKAIAYRLTSHLAYIRRRSPDESPIPFTYDAPTGRLRAADREAFGAAVEKKCRGKLPGDAVSSVEPLEHYVRLRFLPELQQPRLVSIYYNYETRFGAAHNEPKSTIGTLANLAGAIAGDSVNLLEVSNAITSRDQDRETGSIVLIGDHTATAEGVDDAACASLQSKLDNLTLPGQRRRFVRVCSFRRSRVFVSRRQHGPADASDEYRALDAAIDDVRKQFSITCTTTESWTNPPPDLVLKDIRESDAFLQILWLRPNETPADANLSWLISEYAIATALQLPTVRLADTSKKVDWDNLVRFSVSPLRGFDATGKPEYLREVFATAFTELKKNV